MGITFNDDHIVITPPKNPKRLTGTRFATVMGLNAWATPFESWCNVTRTWEEPFVDNKYTIAGKTLEPKIIDYLNDRYFLDLSSAEDIYGEDYFKKTWGNFFPNVEIFGGMWDALGDNFVVEIKTTKRAEDWQIDIPIYYKLQSALYAHLLGFDRVLVTATFLEDKDYLRPEDFKPSVQNTTIFEYYISEDFPNFEDDYIKPALEFWENHVLTGISPKFDEKKDKKILDELRTNVVPTTDKDMLKLLDDLEKLQDASDNHKEKGSVIEDSLKKAKANLRDYMMKNFRDDDDKVEVESPYRIWSLSKSVRESVDTDRLKADGLYNEYRKINDSYTLRNKVKES